jgi:YwiC-like protein
VADHATHLAIVPDRCVSSLIAPREHGAWGLLLVPLVTGGAVGLLSGGNPLPLATLTIAALALFWLRTPVESWLGTGLLRAQTAHERRSVVVTIVILASVAACALIPLFRDGRNRDLLPLGVAAVLAFIAQSLLRKLSRRTRMLAQIVGTLGLTIMAPAAYYVVTGRLDRSAWALWIANFLFAGNQIHFVQLRIHSARINGWACKLERGRAFLFGESLLAGTLLIAWFFRVLPGLAALAFLPLLTRGIAWFFQPQKPLLVRRLGWTELAHAVLFGALLIAGFSLSR